MGFPVFSPDSVISILLKGWRRGRLSLIVEVHVCEFSKCSVGLLSETLVNRRLAVVGDIEICSLEPLH
jgi:hypothetical protein